MGELADHAGLAKEAVARLTAGEFRGEELDGHGTINERVMSANDAAVGTRAEGFENLVAADLQGRDLLRAPIRTGAKAKDRGRRRGME
jgi:hypothetical protein